MEEFPSWDKGFLPTTVLPVEDALTQPAPADPANSPDYAEDPDHAGSDPESEAEGSEGEEDQDETEKAIRRMYRALGGEALIQPARRTRGKKVTARDRQIWRAHMAMRKPALNAFRSRFTRELMKARSQTLAKIGNHCLLYTSRCV